MVQKEIVEALNEFYDRIAIGERSEVNLRLIAKACEELLDKNDSIKIRLNILQNKTPELARNVKILEDFVRQSVDFMPKDERSNIVQDLIGRLNEYAMELVGNDDEQAMKDIMDKAPF